MPCVINDYSAHDTWGSDLCVEFQLGHRPFYSAKGPTRISGRPTKVTAIHGAIRRHHVPQNGTVAREKLACVTRIYGGQFYNFDCSSRGCDSKNCNSWPQGVWSPVHSKETLAYVTFNYSSTLCCHLSEITWDSSRAFRIVSILRWPSHYNG